MSHGPVAMQQALVTLKGKPAWGLVRTHGSMFFLEIGKPLPQVGEEKMHGEWHFLFEICHWRIEDGGSLVVGSDDSQEFIDQKFAGLQLESIHGVEILPSSHDLRIIFSSGHYLTTFCTSAASTEQWMQWQLFDPHDNVWISDATGRLSGKNAHE